MNLNKSLIYLIVGVLVIVGVLGILVLGFVLTEISSAESPVRDIPTVVRKEISQWRDNPLNRIFISNIQSNVERSQMIHDSSQNVNIGNNTTVTGSTINLGTINASVTNTINQLPADDSNQVNPKDLLTQLQTAINSDESLPDDDKADLLEQVQNLAEATQTEELAKKEGIVRKAKKIFDATLKNLPDTAKIVEACSKLLPLILKALGVPVP
jgi:hypothetical protein